MLLGSAERTPKGACPPDKRISCLRACASLASVCLTGMHSPKAHRGVCDEEHASGRCEARIEERAFYMRASVPRRVRIFSMSMPLRRTHSWHVVSSTRLLGDLI